MVSPSWGKSLFFSVFFGGSIDFSNKGLFNVARADTKTNPHRLHSTFFFQNTSSFFNLKQKKIGLNSLNSQPQQTASTDSLNSLNSLNSPNCLNGQDSFSGPVMVLGRATGSIIARWRKWLLLIKAGSFNCQI